MSGSGIRWAICKSASHSRQITMPVPHHSVFYRPDALPAAQPTVSVADPCTKSEVSSVSRCGDITCGVKFQNGSPDPDHAPFRKEFFIGRVGLAMVSQ